MEPYGTCEFGTAYDDIYIYIYELLLAIRIGCHDLFCAVGQALSRGLFLHLYRWKP